MKILPHPCEVSKIGLTPRKDSKIDVRFVPGARLLYKIARTDEGADRDYGNNYAAVVCVEKVQDLEPIISELLLTDWAGGEIHLNSIGLLTRESIEVMYLGEAHKSVETGVVLVANAGS